MKRVAAVVFTVAGISAAAWGFAAQPAESGHAGMHGTRDGSMEMMEKGGGCPMMGGGMGRGMTGTMPGAGMPALPPGNEKLQLQMWGEMMQKMGEIAGKYAAQVK